MLQKALAQQHLFFFFSYAPSRGPYTWSEWIDPRSEPGPLAGRRAAVSLTDQGPSSLSLLWHSGQSISPSNAFVLVRSGWRCVSR